MTIVYIPGEDNTVADALSQVPDSAFLGKTTDTHMSVNHIGINVTLSIMTDPSILRMIQDGYKQDEFCKKLISSAPSTQGIHSANGL